MDEGHPFAGADELLEAQLRIAFAKLPPSQPLAPLRIAVETVPIIKDNDSAGLEKILQKFKNRNCDA